ncbi:predicted protein [Naegleria gruberi]|uniref:Predicted protein n=1 Tax=Naegleria gruberi TaxID=5762 RepID=D2VUD7_NAEGR|nr:uncharacterized protein NAEGRDRAFT_72626 [Naegleria gruberi]EFC39607.1 predicted protein [Naegleria gruberi]|eukprot:XP_002672351.1 predicted protein [Naegleria gruberi strain NEG-M]
MTSRYHQHHWSIMIMILLIISFSMIVNIHAAWDFSRFSTHMEQIQQLHNTFFANIKGGASTAILFRNETVGEVFAGIAQGNQKPTRDTKYRIASVTKTFVSAAMMALRDEGLIDLDQSVCDFVPEFCTFPNPDGLSSNFTFRQLSSYLSGLPREAPCVLTACDYSNGQIMQRIKENGLFLVRDGDHYPIYSNLGYSFLGHALESAAKISFEQVIQSRILDKLGMKNSGFVNKDNLNNLILAEGYHESERIYTNNKTISWSQPAAGMYSSIADLTLYVKNLMNAFANYGNKMETSIMSRQTLREFLNAQHVLPHGSAAVGLSWEMVHYPFLGGWAIMKSGLIGGYNAQVVMIPHCEMAVITLLSRDDGAQSLALQSAATIASAMKDYLTELREKEIAGNFGSLVSQYKQSGNIVSLELGNVTNSNQKLLNIRNPISSLSQSFNLLPSKENEFIIQPYDIPTRVQYEKGLGGSRVMTRSDLANITSPDFDLFANTLSTSNKRNLERQAITSVCNHIPKDVSLSLPITQSDAATALKNLGDSVSAFASQTGSKVAIQVNYKGQQVIMFTFGSSTDSTSFNIGTLTQLFTSTAILIAKEKGLIKSLDDPIVKYLPQIVYQENLPFENNMTIRQLMNHASGLPIIAPCDDTDTCSLNWNQYVEKTMAEQHIIQPSSTLRTFSTIGFSILGRLIASLKGVVSFNQFVTDNILTPLKMTDSGFKSASFLASNSEMYSSIRDVSKFLNCISGIHRECSIIKKESSRLLHLRNLLSNDKAMSMSLGSFEHEFSNGIWFASKYGSIKGYSSYVAMNDDLDLSVVVLSSSDNNVGKYLVNNQSAIPNLFKAFTTALQQQPSFLKANTSLPSQELLKDMKGIYKVFDQFLLFTQYLQIDYNAQLGLITFAFVESATPAQSSASPNFVLEMISPQDNLTYKVKTLSTFFLKPFSLPIHLISFSNARNPITLSISND